MSNIIIQKLETADRSRWEELFHGYAEFYHVPLEDQTKNTVWEWIFDDENDFWCDPALDQSE